MKLNDIKIGFLPAAAELYISIFGDDFRDQVRLFAKQAAQKLKFQNAVFEIAETVTTEDETRRQVEILCRHDIDLLVVVLGPYCASGVLSPALIQFGGPLLLWPAQTIYELAPNTCSDKQIMLSHGVHAVQDIANILKKADRPFGLMHKHPEEKDILDEFKLWAQAAKIYSDFCKSRPIQIGGHFEDMLDLQIGDQAFIKDCRITPHIVSREEFIEIRNTISQDNVNELLDTYKKEFVIDKELTEEILQKAAIHDLTVRKLMDKYKSNSCGINFLELCNDSEIADGMHVAASRLMAEGKGYAAEGDWVTAAFTYAMQQAFGLASFSEIFSVGYKNNRLLLKHWGEGNPCMARQDPRLLKSKLADKIDAEFAIVDFDFKTGPAMLVNLNCDRNGKSQLISISGKILSDKLDNITGPRAVFNPNAQKVQQVLDAYAYNGGSHHLVLVMENIEKQLEKLSKLSGWNYNNIDKLASFL